MIRQMFCFDTAGLDKTLHRFDFEDKQKRIKINQNRDNAKNESKLPTEGGAVFQNPVRYRRGFTFGFVSHLQLKFRPEDVLMEIGRSPPAVVARE